ncbi:MAG: DUF3500 domain-containing protein [Chloroflexi bacterium]|nr:DUF3500 domain-containing protein [Chloroflexota bacterium]
MSNKTHRLFPAILIMLVALFMTACGAATPAASPAASTAASASPAASAATASPAATTSAATAEATTPAETATSGTTSGQDATPAVVAAANAFLATLSDTERESVLFDWTDTEQKQRWSNLPEGLYERAGLMWGDLSEEQQNAWLAIMQVTLSEEGYNRVIAEWNADEVLATESTGGGGGPGGGQLLFGKQYYYVALIGTPSETEPWQWQWGGHHVTVNATVAGSNIALTPSFIGCQPCEYTDASGTTIRPLGDIEDEAFALVSSLDATQQQAAVLGNSSIDLVLGPGQEGKTIQSEGLAASQMTAEQQAALLQLIGHYTGLVNDEDAAARNDEIQSTLAETYFAWYGPTTEGSAAYFRITGPTIVIEYAPQGGGGNGTGLGGAATNLHIHGVYRDPSNEYGAKYTQ